MPHFCRICGRDRANEAFSGKGRRIHVCKKCARMPKEERQAIEQKDELAGFMRQKHISEKNVARLHVLKESPNPRIARLARLVLEVVAVKPYRKKRLGLLIHDHPDLLARLIEAGLMDEWDIDWNTYPEYWDAPYASAPEPYWWDDESPFSDVIESCDDEDDGPYAHVIEFCDEEDASDIPF